MECLPEQEPKSLHGLMLAIESSPRSWLKWSLVRHAVGSDPRSIEVPWSNLNIHRIARVRRGTWDSPQRYRRPRSRKTWHPRDGPVTFTTARGASDYRRENLW